MNEEWHKIKKPYLNPDLSIFIGIIRNRPNQKTQSKQKGQNQLSNRPY